ncbi:MAG: hypothetical protein MJY67_04935 [Bacteroidales bacterium]|nr:hypothetical protein [Bacteroidales bacterium]
MLIFASMIFNRSYLLAALMPLFLGACSLFHTREGGKLGRDALRKGDLIFVGAVESADTSMSDAIVSATGDGRKNYFHVAIVDMEDNGDIYIIDAGDKRGVSRYPLDTFLVDFSYPDGSLAVMDVMRVKRLGRSVGALAVERARSFLVEDYDWRFLPDNGSHYCSELVYDSFLDRRGRRIFHAAPMNFLAPDGSLPLFWEELFDSLDMPVPQGIEGTNPQDMSLESCLRSLDVTL